MYLCCISSISSHVVFSSLIINGSLGWLLYLLLYPSKWMFFSSSLPCFSFSLKFIIPVVFTYRLLEFLVLSIFSLWLWLFNSYLEFPSLRRMQLVTLAVHMNLVVSLPISGRSIISSFHTMSDFGISLIPRYLLIQCLVVFFSFCKWVSCSSLSSDVGVSRYV